MTITDFRLATLDATQAATWSRVALAARELDRGDIDWYDEPAWPEATSGFRPAAPPLPAQYCG